LFAAAAGAAAAVPVVFVFAFVFLAVVVAVADVAGVADFAARERTEVWYHHRFGKREGVMHGCLLQGVVSSMEGSQNCDGFRCGCFDALE